MEMGVGVGVGVGVGACHTLSRLEFFQEDDQDEYVHLLSITSYSYKARLPAHSASTASPPVSYPAVKFPVCVVKSPLCVKLPILPNKNSNCRYAALGAYCGIICPLRLTSTNVSPRSVCVVPNTPAPANVESLSSL